MQVLSRKFTVALISTFLFSFLLALIVTMTQSDQYLTFSMTVLTFIVLSAPMFLIVGVAVSFLFEKNLRSTTMKWFSYIIIGAAFTVPYALYFFEDANLLLYSIIGGVGAAIYCGIHLIFDKYIFKNTD
ncbi:hypothetical protein MKZ25_08250 [Solibacillus sp. FSL W7-1464]|uniref:hypothetical protein n=1 Tax=Solibacillus sp. FSL W7-1464 TaxID=2921706 RepID=UPI0030F9EA46